jgi:hypothetical protein
MCQIKLVRLQLRLQLKILQLGNAAQQARRTLGAISSHPRQFPTATVSQSSHKRPKNTTEEGIDRCFQYFEPTTEKPKRKHRLLI